MGLIKIQKKGFRANSKDDYVIRYYSCTSKRHSGDIARNVARVTSVNGVTTAVVRNAHGSEFIGIATYYVGDVYDERFGDELAILKALRLKEKDRYKRMTRNINFKKKQMLTLAGEIGMLINERNNTTINTIEADINLHLAKVMGGYIEEEYSDEIKYCQQC